MKIKSPDTGKINMILNETSEKFDQQGNAKKL